MQPTFFSRYAFAILLVTAFLCPIVFIGAARALKSNKNDVAQWLPPVYEETQRFKEFQARFGGEEFVLVSWDGCTLDDDRLTLFNAKLDRDQRGASSLFETVLTGPEAIKQMVDVKVPEEEAIQRLKGSLIGPDGKTTCAVLTLSAAGRANLKEAIARIENTATRECNVPAANLHMGGPPVDNVAIDRAGEQSLFRLAGIAAGIGLVISWWCLRSLKLVLLAFASGILSSATSLAIVYYTGSSMNAILLTMPSLVYVAAISGSIHLTNYYRDTIVEKGLHGATGRAVKHAALPIFLATVTTAFGLASLAYSELVPIELFGVYSAIGVTVSAAYMMLYLPAALEFWPESHLEKGSPQAAASTLPDPFTSPRWEGAGRWIVRQWGVVLVGCVVCMAICAWGLNYAQTSIQMMKLFSKDARILQDYAWLEEHLGELIPMEVVVSIPKDSPNLSFLERAELMDEIQDTVNEIPNVGSSLSAATFMPSIGEPYVRPRSSFGVRDWKAFEARRRNNRLLSHRDEILAGDYLRETEDGRELWRVSARVAALKDIDYGVFIQTLKEAVDPIIEDYRTTGVPDLQVEYTGLVPLIYKAQRSLLDGLVSGFAMDLVLITIVMMLAVRSISAGLLLILPSIFPAVIIFGVMSWFRIPIDIGTVMTPAVALGVTVDDVVHFMLKYRRAVEKGESRGDAVMTAYRGCARAMYQSWGVIGLGLSVFALSPFTPTQRFGYLIVTLLSAALPGNLLLLPALLLSPLGVFFGRPPRKKRNTKPAAEIDSREAESKAKNANVAHDSPTVASSAGSSEV